MDLEQHIFNQWYLAQKDLQKHMENIEKVGGLGAKINLPKVEPGAKCFDCGGELAWGVTKCPGIKYDGIGVAEVCPKCQAGIGHPSYRCMNCKRIFPAEDIWNRKKHFFMNSKPKLIHAR